MDQAPFEPSKRSRGGDTHTPQARVDIARREEQIVALRLRHHSYSAIGRVVGISKQNAQKAFLRAPASGNRDSHSVLVAHTRFVKGIVLPLPASVFDLATIRRPSESRLSSSAALRQSSGSVGGQRTSAAD
jgi:hypothetical protein